MAELEVPKGREGYERRTLMSAGKKGPGSHLRAEAPVFSPEELPRPANLRNLKTRRANPRLEALDLVPFTPSQGVLTPSPNNFAAATHEQHLYAVYPATPQVTNSVQYTEQGSIQSSSDESSGASFTSTFSPFHWPMPVSPTAFPVRQGHYVMSTMIDASRTGQYSPMMTATSSSDYMYPFPMQPGSPVYVGPGSPLVGAAWNQPFNRQCSRLSGPVAGPIFVMQGPGSPMYPGMTPGEFPQGIAMTTVFPVPQSPSLGGPGAPNSPMWAGPMQMGPFSMQPSTPPRTAHQLGNGKADPPSCRGTTSISPEAAERAGSSSLSDSTPERSPGIPGVPGTFMRAASEHPGMGRMNARQRRTLRRAQEREAKMRAEQEAKGQGQQEAAAAAETQAAEGEQEQESS